MGFALEKLEKSQKIQYFTIFHFFKLKNEKFLTYHQKMKIFLDFALKKLEKNHKKLSILQISLKLT